MSERYGMEVEHHNAYGVHEDHFGCEGRIERAARASRVQGLDVKARVRKAKSKSDLEREAMKREIAELRAELRAVHTNVAAVLRRLHAQQTSSVPSIAAQTKQIAGHVSANLRDLGSRYDMPAPDEVGSHCVRRPLLGALLAEAADELNRRFGQAKLALLARDDERLVIAVDTDLEVDEAEERLAAFRREWWQHKIDVEDRTAVKLRFV